MWGSWTSQEKRQLLEAVKKYGPSNIAAIADELPFRSVEGIRLAINYFETRAINSLKCSQESTPRKSPLDNWRGLFKSAPDPYAKAIKYIALFEKRSKAKDVNLDCCYELLTSFMHGTSPRATNEETLFFLYSTLVKVVQSIKKGDVKCEKEFIKRASLSAVPKRQTYGSKKKRSRLLDNANINILSIPADLVKMDADKI